MEMILVTGTLVPEWSRAKSTKGSSGSEQVPAFVCFFDADNMDEKRCLGMGVTRCPSTAFPARPALLELLIEWPTAAEI